MLRIVPEKELRHSPALGHHREIDLVVGHHHGGQGFEVRLAEERGIRLLCQQNQRGCGQQNLQATGGNGLFYCFAIN